MLTRSRGRALRGLLIVSLGFVVLAARAPRTSADALSPEEAQKHFKLADGFEVQLFASEPQVRQPVTMTFDERGRLWVVQYLQYPTPKDLKPVTVDRYLRTKYDRVPEPPPKGPQGADKITILEDTDGDGRVDKVKDFVSGLNLASALAIGNGGVYVGQAPYLLFYPDRDGDDVPDGDPEVLLSGFGLEDAHAVINSLQFAPDGWLYGTQGSTVTADVRGIGFQQGIWRYHPATKRFELFSEGGGNTWGLDFDRQGNAIAGTNWGDALCLHQVQGGYYVKGFTKHGPLHNPYTYGYFDHVKHTGHVGGHVTCGGIVYQGSAFPKAFQNAYIGANLLSNAIYFSKFEQRGSTFSTHFVGTLLETDDIWFRPIDCLIGPDGSLFVADWYDQRANHVIPDDTWDRSNGRIWKIVYRGTASEPAPPQPIVATPIAKLTSDALIDLLGHPNVWQRREARRILSERRDTSTFPRLTNLVRKSGDEHLALEALWALYASGGWSDSLALELLSHPQPEVRAWTIRWLGDDRRPLPPALEARLIDLAAREASASVRSQLACTAKRLLGGDALPIVARLLRRDEDAADPHVPLLAWWAIEDKVLSDRAAVLDLLADPATWQQPLVRGTVAERLARRYLAERNDLGYEACARLLALAPSREDRLMLVSAMDKDFSGQRLPQVPAPLAEPLAKLWSTEGSDPTVIRFTLRMGSREAYERALARLSDPAEPTAVRLALIAAVGQCADPEALAKLLPLLDEASGPDAGREAIRSAALAALEHFSAPTIGDELVARYEKLSPALRTRAVSLLCSRTAWSLALVAAVNGGKIDPKDVSVDQIRQMLAQGDQPLATAVEARWGKIRPATPGEKMAYVPVLGRVLGAGPGDLDSGHKLFMKHCGTCHLLHGEGTKVGPDLTSADRKNRDALLLNILDPSGYIRPEYVSQTAVLNDGRVLTGLVVESDAQRLTFVDSKSQKTQVGRDEIESISPATLSVMPERLLETLSPQEVRDLFRYLQSDAPVAPVATP